MYTDFRFPKDRPRKKTVLSWLWDFRDVFFILLNYKSFLWDQNTFSCYDTTILTIQFYCVFYFLFKWVKFLTSQDPRDIKNYDILTNCKGISPTFKWNWRRWKDVEKIHLLTKNITIIILTYNIKSIYNFTYKRL